MRFGFLLLAACLAQLVFALQKVTIVQYVQLATRAG